MIRVALLVVLEEKLKNNDYKIIKLFCADLKTRACFPVSIQRSVYLVVQPFWECCVIIHDYIL